jgi:hypothetical protein
VVTVVKAALALDLPAVPPAPMADGCTWETISVRKQPGRRANWRWRGDRGMTTHESQTRATERAATPTVARQPDGVGKRAGEIAEITLVVPVKPGGADKFRQNAAKFQTDAWHYESLVGTVHDFRVVFFDNDTQCILAVSYDGDFKPYLSDIVDKAAPWFDEMFTEVIEGYPGSTSPKFNEWLMSAILEADMWYASNPAMTVKDTAKAQKVTQAFGTLLDAASS